MSHLIKIYAVYKFSYLCLWYNVVKELTEEIMVDPFMSFIKENMYYKTVSKLS